MLMLLKQRNHYYYLILNGVVPAADCDQQHLAAVLRRSEEATDQGVNVVRTRSDQLRKSRLIRVSSEPTTF
jgi:hypothetical protein